MKKRNIIDKSFIRWVLLAFCIFMVYRVVFDFGGVASNLFGILSFISRLLAYFLWGFAIAFILNQIMNAYERLYKFVKKENIRRILAIVSTYITTIGFITLFIVAIMPVIALSLKELVANIPSYVKNIQNIYSELQVYLFDKFEIVLSDYVKFDSAEIAEKVTDYVTSGDGLFLTFSKWFTTTTNFIINVVFGFVISLYMLINKKSYIESTKNFVDAVVPEKWKEKVYKIAKRANVIFSKTLYGKLIDSMCIGVIAYIAFLLIGVNYPLLLAFIIGLTNMISYFGPLVGAVTASGIILFTNSEIYMFVVSLIVIIALQQFDGWVIEPRILKGQIGVSPLIIIAGVSIGGSLGGFLGMMMGVPILTLTKELLYDEYILNKINKKKKAQMQMEEVVLVEQEHELAEESPTETEEEDL